MIELTDLPDEPNSRWRLWPDRELTRRLFALGAFVMMAMVTQFLVNAADSKMVGHLPRAEATASQAALALGMPLYWAIGGFFSAVSFGTQAITARRFAEGDEQGAGRVLFNSLVVATIAGLIGSVIAYISSPFFVDLIAVASDEQRRLGTSYVQLRSFGIASMVLTFSYKAFFDGISRTYVHLLAAVAMNVINIGLNYLFIFGEPSLGIPKMGLDGAGLASTISTYFGLFIMVAVSLRPRYRRAFQFYTNFQVDWRLAEQIVRLLLPSGSAQVILMAGFLLFVKFVGEIDAEPGMDENVYSAAAKALMDTAAFCFMPLLAFGTATATAVSQSLGKNKPNLAARYGWDSVRLGAWTMVVIAIIFGSIPESIIGLWAPNDPEVVRVAVGPLRLLVTSFPLMAFGLILSQALYGAGANTYVMVVEGALHLGVLVPLSWLLGPVLGFGLMGIFAAAVVYIYALGIAMAVKFVRSDWREIKL